MSHLGYSSFCKFIGGPKNGHAEYVPDAQDYISFAELPPADLTPPNNRPNHGVAPHYVYRRTGLYQFVYDGPSNKQAEVKP